MKPASPLKVAHVVFSLDPGGMENGIVNVANGLDPRDFEVHIACLERAGAFTERLRPEIKVRVIGREGQGFSLDLVRRLRQFFREIQPDLVHTHNLGPLIYGLLAADGGFGVPVLHGEHGKLQVQDLTSRRLLERRLLYLGCRGVHTVSSELAEAIRPLAWPASKVFNIRNGVDTTRFSPQPSAAAREELGLTGAGPFLGLIGRLIPLKRHLDMIDAFAEIGRRFPTAQLLLVGNEGPLKGDIEAAIAASSVGERIHLRPFRQDPRSYYHALDLLVVPSIVEGLSNVVLEAMSCGLPLLVHDACGNAEVAAGGRCLCVEPIETRERLAAAVIGLLDNPERMRQLGLEARREAERNLSLESMVAGYAEAYRRLAKRRPASRPPEHAARPLDVVS